MAVLKDAGDAAKGDTRGRRGGAMARGGKWFILLMIVFKIELQPGFFPSSKHVIHFHKLPAETSSHT